MIEVPLTEAQFAAAAKRLQLGVIVLLFLFGMLALTYALKHEFWRDIH